MRMDFNRVEGGRGGEYLDPIDDRHTTQGGGHALTAASNKSHYVHEDLG